MLLVASGLFSMFFFNTLYLQRVLDYSALEAGLAFLPFTAGIIIGAGPLPEARAGDRRAGGSADRDDARRGRPAPLRAARARTAATSRLPSGRHARVDRHGPHVRPGDARSPRAGSLPSDAGLASGLYNTSQQVGGALGLAILSTFAVSKTEDTLSGLGREPGPADQAQALVDGFHIAYIGSAVAHRRRGAIMLALLLRRSDVVAVGEGVAEPVAA